jgi:hypothetical protein
LKIKSEDKETTINFGRCPYGGGINIWLIFYDKSGAVSAIQWYSVGPAKTDGARDITKLSEAKIKEAYLKMEKLAATDPAKAAKDLQDFLHDNTGLIQKEKDNRPPTAARVYMWIASTNEVTMYKLTIGGAGARGGGRKRKTTVGQRSLSLVRNQEFTLG